MAVWSVVKMSELEGRRRLDAEYYRPEYLKLNRLLSKHPPLGQCVEKIIHPVEIKRVYENQGLHILLAQNIQHNFLEFSVTVFMPESVRGLISRNKLIPNDVVMTRSGANYGDASAYFGDPAPLYACADDLVIRSKPDLLAGYLATFFNTDSGRALIKRGGYGAGQPHIAPPFLKTLHVPRFSPDVEQKVDGLVRPARDELKQSESIYLQAEKMVLNEIDWDKLALSQPKWWAVSLSRAQGVHRLDAEHFQPKYNKLIAHLNKTAKAKNLGGEIAPYIKRGLQPEYVEEGEIIIVNSQHLGRYLLNVEATERTNKKFWNENKSARLQKNDVLLYSTGAYIGRTNPWLEDQEGIASNHVTIIRPNPSCNPLYLAVFLNAPVGLLQTEKWASGSGQREIYPGDIARYLVYLPSETFQQRVADLVQKSYKARQKAKALLEEAKAKVEALIEGRKD
jgi:restriction endonuclease S subunit